MIYIPLPPPTVCKLLTHIFEAIRVYGLFVGLRINPGKSAFLLKGEWGEDHKRILASFGVPVKAKIRYLGIVLGHVSSEEAYVPTIARAMQRAEFMRTLPLTHQERVALFQEWVLPLLIFPGQGVFPDRRGDIPGVSSVQDGPMPHLLGTDTPNFGTPTGTGG